MITLTQVVLVLVISVLTTLLVVIGIQVVKILQELRMAMEKMNRILDDTVKVTHSVTQPVVGLANMAESLRGGLKLVTLVRKLLGHEEEAETETEAKQLDQPQEFGEMNENGNGEEKNLSYIEQLQEKGREASQQFFHRNGRPLG